MILSLLAQLALAAPLRLGDGPVVADGATLAEVRLWLGPDAKTPKVTSPEGRVASVARVGDGSFVVSWMPPTRAAAGTIPWTVTVDGEATTLEIPVVPRASGRVVVTVDPPVVAPGAVATVTLRPEGGTATPAERRRWLVAASAGTLSAPVAGPDGTWTAQWTAPKVTNPQAAALVAADADAPGALYGAAAARVSSRELVSVDAPAGARCVLTVGGAAHEATAKGGKASFDLELDPANLTGTLAITRADGAVEERVVQLPVGATSVAFVPGPTAFVAGDPVVLRVAGLGADGAPWTAQPPRITGAPVRAITPDGAVWRVELEPLSGPVELVAAIGGVEVKQTLTAVPLGAWALTAAPEALPATGKVTAVVTAAGPSAPAWLVRAGTGTPPKAGGAGWVSTITLAEGAPSVQVAVAPVAPRSALPPAAVALSPEWPVATAGQAAGLRAVVVDAAGLPVVDAEVELSVVSGDAALPVAKLRTDALGVARGVVTPGPTAGPIVVRATAGGRWTEATLLQVDARGGPDLSVEPTGPAARWAGAVRELTVWREGQAPLRPPVTAALPVEAPAAAVSEAPEKTPKTPKTPKDRPKDGAVHRVGVSLTDAHGAGQFSADGAPYTDTDYTTPVSGFVGLQLALDWQVAAPVGALSAVVRADGRVELFGLDSPVALPTWGLAAGPRWRPLDGPVRPDVSLLVAGRSAIGFREGPGGTEGFAVSRGGVRPEVGVELPLGPLLGRAEAGVTLGPAPVDAGGGVSLTFGELALGARPQIGLSVEHAGWTFTRGAASGTIAQTRAVVALGAVW